MNDNGNHSDLFSIFLFNSSWKAISCVAVVISSNNRQTCEKTAHSSFCPIDEQRQREKEQRDLSLTHSLID